VSMMPMRLLVRKRARTTPRRMLMRTRVWMQARLRVRMLVHTRVELLARRPELGQVLELLPPTTMHLLEQPLKRRLQTLPRTVSAGTAPASRPILGCAASHGARRHPRLLRHQAVSALKLEAATVAARSGGIYSAT